MSTYVLFLVFVGYAMGVTRLVPSVSAITGKFEFKFNIGYKIELLTDCY
jgi:hypothetical protein